MQLHDAAQRSSLFNAIDELPFLPRSRDLCSIERKCTLPNGFHLHARERCDCRISCVKTLPPSSSSSPLIFFMCGDVQTMSHTGHETKLVVEARDMHGPNHLTCSPMQYQSFMSRSNGHGQPSPGHRQTGIPVQSNHKFQSPPLPVPKTCTHIPVTEKSAVRPCFQPCEAPAPAEDGREPI